MTIQFAPRWTDATTTQTCVVGNATDIASAANSTLLDLQVNNVSKFTVDKFGELILTPTARTSGSDSLLNLIAPADTTRAAGVEATDINFNLARTVQFAAGNITDQRAVRIQAPTYSFASASTITNASTLSISGPPVAGTNATITNAYALNVESGTVRFGRGIIVGDSSIVSLRPSFGIDIVTVDSRRRLLIASNAGIAFSTANDAAWDRPADVMIQRDSARALAFYSATVPGSTTNAITLRSYNVLTDASNYERLALQFGTYSSARYAQIAAESAGTGTANINLVLTPRGTGALIAGPPPDGTAVGGNARGQYAVDLQVSRGLNTQVASGQYSFVSGFSNIANNRCSVAFGYESVTTGEDACAIGQRCTASGKASMAINLNSQATNAFSFASGLNSVADRVAMRAHASGGFSGSGSGVAQYVRFVLRNKTVGTTPAELKMWGIDGNNEYRLTIPAGVGLSAFVILKGFKSDGSVGARFTRMVDIKNVGGTTSLETTPETYGTDYNPSACIYTITADDTNDALQLAVTGVAGETWRWVAVVYGVELAYGT